MSDVEVSQTRQTNKTIRLSYRHNVYETSLGVVLPSMEKLVRRIPLICLLSLDGKFPSYFSLQTGSQIDLGVEKICERIELSVNVTRSPPQAPLGSLRSCICFFVLFCFVLLCFFALPQLGTCSQTKLFES